MREPEREERPVAAAKAVSKHDEPAELFAATCEMLMRGGAAAKVSLAELYRFADYGAGWLKLGETLLRLRQPSAAQVAFERTLQTRPGSMQAALGKGSALREQGRPTEAAAWLGTCCSRWPGRAEPCYELGRAYYVAGALAECLGALRRAVHLAPAWGEAWFHLGLAEQDTDDPRAAAAAYRRALAIEPSMAKAALNLGTVLQDMRDVKGAMGAYAAAIRLNPGYFNRIAQALTSSSTGRLWLDPCELRRVLEGWA